MMFPTKRSYQACFAPLVIASAFLFAASAAQAAGPRWHQDLKKAREEAKQTGKPMLVLITGSDWCPYCIKLERGVFSQTEFKEWAQENVVLMIADFPRRKRLSADVKRQNEQIKANYGVTGYPTVVFANAEGEAVGRMGGYSGASASDWIKSAQRHADKGRPAEGEGPIKWETSYEDALARAEDEGKLVLMNFTGGDRHKPSQALNATVFSDVEFRKWAYENVVALKIDSLRKKREDREVAKAKQALKLKYKVVAFPTTLILNTEGEELHRVVQFRRGTKLEDWKQPVVKIVEEHRTGTAESDDKPEEEPQAQDDKKTAQGNR